MKTIGIIPSRYNSSRFPGKPLVDINGKTMIQRVFEQASSCKILDAVYVATDDKRIESNVLSFGGKVVMTSSLHQNGTDRCKEAIDIIEKKQKTIYQVIINIQGDEPFIQPEQISLLASCFENKNTQIATLIKKLKNIEYLCNPNIIKVVINKTNEAIYFSRAAIPFIRDNKENDCLKKHNFYKHIGIYAYRKDILKEITKLSISSLEKAESLEQLRWIENAYKIQTKETNIESQSIDTPEDLGTVIAGKKENRTNDIMR